mmetsp:Transcript_37597/g.77226  ORF Transcript_37597/g.77226 Transcript_37597/m.77226 type:complete len:134 (-) Transcript_37597:291-692(-)
MEAPGNPQAGAGQSRWTQGVGSVWEPRDQFCDGRQHDFNITPEGKEYFCEKWHDGQAWRQQSCQRQTFVQVTTITKLQFEPECPSCKAVKDWMNNIGLPAQYTRQGPAFSLPWNLWTTDSLSNDGCELVARAT